MGVTLFKQQKEMSAEGGSHTGSPNVLTVAGGPGAEMPLDLTGLLFPQVSILQSTKHCFAGEQKICKTEQQPAQASIISSQKPQLKQRKVHPQSYQCSISILSDCISPVSGKSPYRVLTGVLCRQSKWRKAMGIFTVTLVSLVTLFSEGL